MVEEIMALLATDPLKAADEMDAMADRLKADAAEVRRMLTEQPSGFVAPGGMKDRVMMQVVNPSGKIIQHVDTGGH